MLTPDANSHEFARWSTSVGWSCARLQGSRGGRGRLLSSGGWSCGLAEWDGRLGGSHVGRHQWGGRERDLSVHMRGRRVVMVYRCTVGIVAQALRGSS